MVGGSACHPQAVAPPDRPGYRAGRTEAVAAGAVLRAAVTAGRTGIADLAA